jgi:ABC-2 type transport system ATP-binding protein
MAVISVDKLAKSFSYYKKETGLKSSLKNLVRREKLTKQAVKSLSFAIEEGEIVGFLGPNGAGKTTTLKILSGILVPTGGEAKVLGYTPWERKKDFKMQISIVMGQKSQLWWDLPANESFQLNKHIYELDEKAFQFTLAELTELLDVKDLLGVQVRRLSLGERMKMEIIAALIHKPRVMFLDEPTIGLDLISQKKMRDFIRYYNEQTHTTVLLTSHYMDDIEDLCKRSIIINEGRLVYDGDLNRVNDIFSGRKLVKVQLSQAVGQERLAGYGAVKAFDGFNGTIEVDKQNIRAICMSILDSLPVVDFNIENIPIEEGIVLLYQKEGSGDEVLF